MRTEFRRIDDLIGIPFPSRDLDPIRGLQADDRARCPQPGARQVSRARAFAADMAMIALALLVLAIIVIFVAPITLWRIVRGLRV